MAITIVRLNGVLGKRFGRRWELDVATPREALRALDALRPGFNEAVLALTDCDFGVTVGGRGKKHQIGAERLELPSLGKTITITPVVQGSANSKGWIQIIAGVVLIAASFIPFLAPFAPTLIGLGISLILGGVAQLLTPSPKTQDGSDSKTRPSYQFAGIINTVGSGECVPVAFGGDPVFGMWIGSAVVSVGYENVDIVAGSTSGGNTSQTGAGIAARPVEKHYDGQQPN